MTDVDAISTAPRPMTGRIIKLVADRGFGWIRGDQDGVDYFFHYTEMQGEREFKSLLVGEAVHFTGVIPPKGPRATNVEVDVMPYQDDMRKKATRSR